MARKLCEKLFKQESGKTLELDPYQTKLIDSILELYPDDYHVVELRGLLRYREAIVSIPRRNGKSTIASVLTTFSLVMSEAPNMGVLASTMTQANIVHNATKYNFLNNPALKARFKVTGFRGIESRRTDKPAHFKIHAGNGDGLQGIGFSGYIPIVVDELHITKAEAYDAAVKGTDTTPSAVVLGITTAGDENSELLQRLYKTGRLAIAGGEDADERFGFWHWTVPEDAPLWDREALLRANPAAQFGRVDIDRLLVQGKANPAGDYKDFKRYRRNEFVQSDAIWLSHEVWGECAGQGIPKNSMRQCVFAIDRTKDWEYITITAAIKIDDVVHTVRVCRIHKPKLEYIEELCVDLYRRFGAEMFVASSSALRELVLKLRDERGLPAEYITEQQLASATVIVASLIGNKRLVHGSDTLIKRQLPKTVVKNSLEGLKVSIQHSLGNIDAVRSMLLACYQAEKTEPTSYQLIVV